MCHILHEKAFFKGRIILQNCQPTTFCQFKDNYNYNYNKGIELVSIKDIGKLFIFVVVGLGTIIVGSFMIRGTMHMWDNVDDEGKDAGNKNTKK